MSTMLEQAIVDAGALKEAAIKNAESAVIEKYADNIREAVESLLEAPEDELGGDLGGLGGEEEAGVPADAISDATPAVADGENLCPCPEADEEVVIDFNQLAAAVGAEEEAMEDEPMGSLGDLDGGMGGEEDSLGGLGDEEEDEIELEESTLNSLIGDVVEALRVDHKPQPTGTTGGITNDVVAEDEEDAALAAQRDSEQAEELKQAKKAVKDLQERLKRERANRAKYAKVVDHLKTKLEETTLFNAKLLYTNKILNSDSLNERQTIKVVEAINQASSISEAKTIYETLQSAVESIRNTKRVPKSLSEAISKKSSAFMPRRDKQENMPNNEFNRWHVLAGIKDKK